MTTPSSPDQKPNPLAEMPTHTRTGKPLLFYVPDELCIAISEPLADPAKRYHRVLQALRDILAVSAAFNVNDALKGRFRDVPSDLQNALMRDLRPRDTTLRQLQGDGIVLRDLTPEYSRQGRSRRAHTPWVVVPPANGDAGGDVTVLYYYGVGPDRGGKPLEPTEMPEAARRVRDLVNFVNLVRFAPLRELHEDTRLLLPVMRAAPNWLAATTEGQSCPSPAGTPAWVPPTAEQEVGYWQFAFKKDAAQAASDGRTHPSDTVIAILDTSPTRGAVGSAATAHPGNTLLQRVYHHVHIDTSPLSVPLDAFAPVEGIEQNTRNLAAQPAELRMDDHGLFVAGIIHDIAPHAETHLIRVLGGYGVSDLSTILPVLFQLPDTLLCNGRTRLVVNMSLGFAIPPGIELLRLWLFETLNVLMNTPGDENRSNLTEMLHALQDPKSEAALREMLDELRTGAREMDAWLGYNPKVLVVAAAGNDAGFFPEPMRPEPRYPAWFDTALGVAAVCADSATPAVYSNRGDVTQLFNGVATFGGNTLRTSADALGASDPDDAVRGLYISPTLFGSAATTRTNATGWVYWAGTSFATPVIAALAATFWEQNPSVDSTAVIEQVVRAFQNAPPEIGADTLDCATIVAWQEFVPVAP